MGVVEAFKERLAPDAVPSTMVDRMKSRRIITVLPLFSRYQYCPRHVFRRLD